MRTAILVTLILFTGSLLTNCSSTPSEEPATEPTSPFIGVWSGPMAYPLIEITKKGDQFRIRECYGDEASKGVEYTTEAQGTSLVAIGNEQDFYKQTFPTFSPANNAYSKLSFNSGLGPVEVIRVDRAMPDIPFNPPVNND